MIYCSYLSSHNLLHKGGMKEMFLSSPKIEKLYLKNRKGFVKMALINGAGTNFVHKNRLQCISKIFVFYDVCHYIDNISYWESTTHNTDILPTYMFGNTMALRLLQNPLLELISRKLKVSMTIMHGRFFLPIPYPVEFVHVRGKIIQLPQISNPSEEEVSFYHKTYVDEIIRLYEKYKVQTRDYKQKKLLLL